MGLPASELHAAMQAESAQAHRIGRAGADASPAATISFFASYSDRSLNVAATTAVYTASSAAIYPKRAGVKAHQLERAALSRLIREMFGNPFHPASLNSFWLAWNDGAIRKMAQAIYDARAFDHLPLLADALEDAGCTDADVLGHCRGGGEHVRGCWVVDLLLQKE